MSDGPVQLPPQNLDAERRVLGSMLRDNSVIPDVLVLVREGDFYADAHRRVFAAVLALYEQGRPADLVTAAELLKQRGHVADLGEDGRGYLYLAGLWEAAPTAANVEYHAAIVRDKALLRGLARVGTEIVGAAYRAAGPADELLQDAERGVLALAEMGVRGTAVPLAEALDAAVARVEARQDRRQGSGLPTGFAELDGWTGGLQAGELTVLAARPSVGKTSLALALLRNLALEHGLPLLFVSLEQSREELAERLIAMEGRVDSHRLRCGLLDDEDQLGAGRAVARLRPLPVWVDDSPSQSVLHIAANGRRFKARHGIRAVLIDYLQLIEPDDRRAARHEQVGAVSRRLKHLARGLQIPVVVLAQLNRESEHRKDPTPRLADLRDSGEIEQTADTVLLMHRPDEPGGVVDVIIAKQRNGPTQTVRLTFEPKHYRFGNVLPEPP
jgi:replicative DNA helicase